MIKHIIAAVCWALFFISAWLSLYLIFITENLVPPLIGIPASVAFGAIAWDLSQ